jgi:hypothetical protein
MAAWRARPRISARDVPRGSLAGRKLLASSPRTRRRKRP